MLEPVDYRDFESHNMSEQDKKLLVRFYLKEREDKAESKREGRPIFKEVEYVEIRLPGRRDPLACRPATDVDKQRFSEHYRRFRERVSEPEEGTPLKEWPRMSRSRVEEMAFFNVKTVEQLVDMSDADAMKFHGGLTIKREAKEWLEASNETALIAERTELKNRVQELEEQLKKFLDRSDREPEAYDTKPRPRPKPKPKPKKTDEE